MKILTVVDAVVPAEREAELLDGFRRLLASEKPEGFLGSELLRGQEGRWRIQTTWRDLDAVRALRASGHGRRPRSFWRASARPTPMTCSRLNSAHDTGRHPLAAAPLDESDPARRTCNLRFWMIPTGPIRQGCTSMWSLRSGDDEVGRHPHSPSTSPPIRTMKPATTTMKNTRTNRVPRATAVRTPR